MSFYEILPSKTIDLCHVAGTLATRKFWFMETLPRGLIPETIPDANHGAGIFTYKTGWFCSGKCWDSYSSTMEHMGMDIRILYESKLLGITMELVGKWNTSVRNCPGRMRLPDEIATKNLAKLREIPFHDKNRKIFFLKHWMLSS
jgi:hypothetical protein